MNNYDEKIVNIKETQKKLLQMVKEEIEENGKIFNINTKNIVDVLTHDDQMVKKYQAVIEAQKLIEEYTKEIINAKSIDEIIEIRKKLNSSINKVKKAMRDRGIDDIEYNNYVQDANNFRKKIAKNIRYLKREDKINEIEELNSNFDNLNEEELLRLKRLIKNEISYGKRNLGIKSVDDNNKFSIPEIEKVDSKEVKKNNDIDIPNIEKRIIYFDTFNSLYDYLDDRVDFFNGQYNITQPENYPGGIIKNIRIFTKNLPKLINNKRKVKYMVRDYNYYCRKPELLGYSQYISNNNSVLNNMKKIVRNNLLSNKESYYKEEHNRAINWIIDYCKENNLEIKYNKRVNA